MGGGGQGIVRGLGIAAVVLGDTLVAWVEESKIVRPRRWGEGKRATGGKSSKTTRRRRRRSDENRNLAVVAGEKLAGDGKFSRPKSPYLSAGVSTPFPLVGPARSGGRRQVAQAEALAGRGFHGGGGDEDDAAAGDGRRASRRRR